MGPAEAVKAELFSAIKLLKLPPFVHGSLVHEVVKELMRRLEDEVIGYLRLSTQLPEIMLERLRLLDDGHVPNAALSISGLIARADSRKSLPPSSYCGVPRPPPSQGGLHIFFAAPWLIA